MSDKNDADKQPTTPPAPPRRGSGKAAPKLAPMPASEGEVLVFNVHQGNYIASRTSMRRDLPSGAGADDPRSRFDIERVIIPPGLFLLTAAQFGVCAAGSGFRKRVADHNLLIVSDDPKMSWAEEWADTRPKRCMEWVEETSDSRTLQRILEVEDRSDVREAIEEHLATIQDEGNAKAAARRAQRAHNRKGARKHRRSGALLS
jgi:hypothetical protein